MKKEEWFSELDRLLSPLPYEEKKKAIDYFEEIYADRADVGYSESAILAEFGTPYKAAEGVIGEFKQENPSYAFPSYDAKTGYAKTENAPVIYKKKQTAPKDNELIRIVLIVLFAIPIFILYVVMGSISIGLFAAAVALIIAGISLPFGGIFAFSEFGLPPLLLSVGGGLILLSLGIALFIGAFLATKYAFKGVNALLSAINKALKGETK